MFKKAISIVLIFLPLNLLFANEKELKTPRYTAGIGEALGYNILQAGFNHYVLNLHFSHISLDTAYENLKSPWVLDFNSFMTNHLGHPYQGVIYFTAARSNHMGFYLSSLNTVIGSVTWEYLMENVQPSINDLVVTTSGGIVLGEIFFRLSDTLWHDNKSPSNILLSSIISPVSNINRTVFNDTSRFVKKQHISGKAYAEYDIMNGFCISTDLNYGDIYSGNTFRPFEYFDFSLSSGFSHTNFVIELYTEGLLKGSQIYLSERDFTSRYIGLFIGMDVIYGLKRINLSANSIGIGYYQKSDLSNNTYLNIKLFTNLIFMGGINDNTAIKESGNYSLGIGENIKLAIGVENIYGSFAVNYKYYGLHLIADRDREESSGKYEITGLFTISIERAMTDSLRIGTVVEVLHRQTNLFASGLTLYFAMPF